MKYLDEFRTNARPLFAAFLGLGLGFSSNSYILSTIAPTMLKDLMSNKDWGWSQAAFAAATSMALLTVIIIPVIGRITDRIGVRRMALVGVLSLPASYVAISVMTEIWQYYAIYAFQSFFCIATSATVYSRVVAGRFVRARGLAMSIFASANAAIGVVSPPLINAFAVTYGWRTSFQLVAVIALVGGLLALALIPSDKETRMTARADATGRPAAVYGPLFRQRTFWVVVAALFLCNLPSVLYLSQINLMLIDRGVSPASAAAMLSTFAVSGVVGRFGTGLCLDRFPMRIVATIAMTIPAIGFVLLVSGAHNIFVLHLCIFLVGMTFGAEGDLMPYLVVHVFGIRTFSSVMGLLTATISLAITIGAIVLSITLKTTGHFTTFLTLSAVSVLIGGLLFLLIRAPVHGADETPVPAH